MSDFLDTLIDRSYKIGSLILFCLITGSVLLINSHFFGPEALGLILGCAAVLMVLTEIKFYFKVNLLADKNWSYLTLVFTALIVAVVVCGSLWIMYNLNYYMMH